MAIETVVEVGRTPVVSMKARMGPEAVHSRRVGTEEMGLLEKWADVQVGLERETLES